jgi:hypothetical protein
VALQLELSLKVKPHLKCVYTHQKQQVAEHGTFEPYDHESMTSQQQLLLVYKIVIGLTRFRSETFFVSMSVEMVSICEVVHIS